VRWSEAGAGLVHFSLVLTAAFWLDMHLYVVVVYNRGHCVRIARMPVLLMSEDRHAFRTAASITTRPPALTTSLPGERAVASDASILPNF